MYLPDTCRQGIFAVAMNRPFMACVESSERQPSAEITGGYSLDHHQHIFHGRKGRSWCGGMEHRTALPAKYRLFSHLGISKTCVRCSGTAWARLRELRPEADKRLPGLRANSKGFWCKKHQFVFGEHW